ncbi:metalloregulator ArsR/SmtB family transcription factor [Bacillus mycoides]|uniref:ArsR/SmtB family transcription factor n=1 Tax=Bacillus TaxID=1386 RepID=UPI000DC30EA4|nr:MULTISPECIES: metalloregulator ArsR/SmtB family transcription factor [Bacillus]MBJ7956908.1 winged helix-turn-helix transcriptional regulator [Bacillus cereus group sp. N28]MDI6529599.1 metalloregulator ArsR/SmtB family transcription factor [Bacillus mycoides]RAN69623.1 transcriptional regulator [Bacillus sp. SRB_8]WJE56872.1 metalloregulator ArsR/SmtB family transcription factor [Bacillus mycoides]WJE62791.1 metalloregulator ArsR/SmtB family transcription factor [Bacillus mycoides]
MSDEQLTDLFKALSNTTRLRIVQLLKDPEKNFPPQFPNQRGEDFPGGVCAGDIQNKIGLVQSTTSRNLSLLQRCGLLENKSVGKRSYYRRNEKVIKQLDCFIRKIL